MADELGWGRLDHRGEFDEVWLKGANVHVERMDETAFWIGMDLPSGNRVSIRTGVHRGVWYFNVDEDGKSGGEYFSIQRPRSARPVRPPKEKAAPTEPADA